MSVRSHRTCSNALTSVPPLSIAGHGSFAAVVFAIRNPRSSGQNTSTPMSEDRYRVQSVERAFALLEALAETGPDGMTLSDLGRSLGVSKSTAYAILQTLLAGGFVADSGTGMSRRYRLGMALARLGDVVVSQIALRDVAMPGMRSLTAETG